jgi:DNA-binding response OmpR family regulator
MFGTKRVLIVDDEESMLLLLGRTVESVPQVEITLAGGCEEGLRLAGSQGYDLILLDLLMPGIGGIEVLQRIRTASPNAATPVIIISVMSDEATKIVCKSLGANAYIVKPIERDAVVAAVQSQLAGRANSPQA